MENISAKTLALTAAGALAAGVALWYMSQDPNEMKFDPEGKHSLEKLHELLHELDREYKCIYIRNYNLMLKIKENGEWKEELAKQIETSVGYELKDITRRYCDEMQEQSKMDINEDLLAQWMLHYKDDPEVMKLAQNSQRLHKQVFTDQKLTVISYQEELPEALDSGMYMQIFRKIWATIRHDLWEAIQDRKEALRLPKTQKLSEEEFSKLYNQVHKKYEDIRKEIYELLMDCENTKKGEARENMQKAYITHASISTITSATGEVVRSRWGDLISVESKQHGQKVDDMANNIFYDGIEIDPRESKLPDSKSDVSSLPGYQPLSTQKTFLSNEKTVKNPVDPKVDKYIGAILQKARDAKARVQARKNTEEAAKKAEEATADAVESEEKSVEKEEAPVEKETVAEEEKPAELPQTEEPAVQEGVEAPAETQ